MPASDRGQLITFAIEVEPDAPRKWMTTSVRKGDTVAAVVGRRGHPEDARLVADKNGIRSVYSHFGKGRKKLTIPKDLSVELSFSVLAGDGAPTITAGYAKIEAIDRPQRTALTVFTGYDPIQMEVPIRFEAATHTRTQKESVYDFGQSIETDIALLERMAGRGLGSVNGSGPPPIVRVGTRDGNKMVPLIPLNYQYDDQNKSAPVWRIADIAWDPNPLRNSAGNRIRQLATVTLRQHTRLSLLSRGVAARKTTKKGSDKPKPRHTAKK